MVPNGTIFSPQVCEMHPFVTFSFNRVYDHGQLFCYIKRWNWHSHVSILVILNNTIDFCRFSKNLTKFQEFQDRLLNFRTFQDFFFKFQDLQEIQDMYNPCDPHSRNTATRRHSRRHRKCLADSFCLHY